MTALELLVRPFERRDVTPPQRILEKEKPVDPVSVSYGQAGSTVFAYSLFSVTEFKTVDAQTYTEVSRDTRVKRIENPSDPSQFVEVEVVDRLYLRHKLSEQDRPIYELKNND
jgi:hypothetical protein